MKNVIHIFGASGSGTTTLGKRISSELGYFHMDTDDYFWMPTDPKFTAKRPAEERIELMKNDMSKADNVVISGSLVDWGDVLIPYFTLAVRIEMDPAIRLERLKRREKDRFGSRIEPGGDMYEQHSAFMKWAETYDSGGLHMRSRAKHDEWQKLLKCEILLLDGSDTLENHLENIKKHL